MKRFFLAFCVLAILAAGAAMFLFRSVSQSGSGAVEQWIGQQLQTIANSYLNPQLTFSDLDYSYPGTVSLKNMRLTAEDPANPGTKIDILGCDNAVVTLAEVPHAGKPIVIEKIALDKPLFSAIAVRPDSKEFIGFSNLVRGGVAAATQPSGSAPGSPTSQPSQAQASRPKLDDVFKIRLIELKDGKVVYDPRIAGTEPMMLDQINTSLKVEPAPSTGSGQAESGWYQFSINLARDPVFKLGLAGQLNLNSFDARDLAMKLNAGLADDKLSYLPPQLQKILKQYEIRGDLSILVIGDLPLMQPMKGSGKTEIKLTNANVTLGEYHIPIDDLALSAGFDDGEVQLTKFDIVALKGTAKITGAMALNPLLDTELHLKINGMLLQELLASRKSGEPLKLAGKVNAAMDAEAPLMVVLAKTVRPSTQPASFAQFASVPLPDKWGSATAEMTDGRLLAVSSVQGLEAALRKATSIVRVRNNDQPPSEEARVAFDMTADKASFSEISYNGDLIAARGKGTIGLDRKLDVTVAAGPIEKVSSLFGKQIGGMIGTVTDQLLSYQITGEIGNAEVKPVVAGGVVQQGGNVVESGVKAVGEGVGKIGEGIGNLLKPKD